MGMLLAGKSGERKKGFKHPCGRCGAFGRKSPGQMGSIGPVAKVPHLRKCYSFGALGFERSGGKQILT